MPTTDTNVPQVIVNKLTKAQYEAATKEPTEFYVVSDEQIGTSDIADGAVTAAKASFTTYSTSEQVVGTWIDGRPIYRRAFTGTVVKTGTTVYTTELMDSDVGLLIGCGGGVALGGNVFQLGSQGTSDIELTRMVVVGDSLRLQTSKQDWTTYTVWADYVKATN